MDEWTQCQTCGLKYRARADGCPRCAKAAAEQPPPDLRDQIPESPVYEPPRYEGGGEARITEYSTGDAAAADTGPFRLPWYLLGGTAVFMLLGAVIAPARPAIGVLLMIVGVLFSIGASIWTLSVAWGLGALWFVATLVFPVVGLIALTRANNYRPFALSVTATLMLLGGAALAGRDLRGSGLTRADYIAECSKKSGPADCACQATAIYEVLDESARQRWFENRQTPEDLAQLKVAMRSACKGVW